MIFTLCAFADEAATTIREQIEALKRNNIEYVEFRSANGKNVSELSTSEVKEMHKQFTENGIKVWSIGSPTGKIDIEDDLSLLLDKFKIMINFANILEASHYRLFSFYGTKGKEHARDEVMTRLSYLVELAEGSGVVLCHENEKDIYGEDAKSCLDIHSSLPEIKAVFDPANFIQSSQSILPAWEMLEPYVEYMHIKDATVSGEIVPAGYGDGELKKLLSMYKGDVISIEPHLSVFDGFDSLEKEKSKSGKKYIYSSQSEAFDVAVNAIKELMV